MDFEKASFADALRFVAERFLFAGLLKEADDAASKAQGARQTLGILGADEGAINAATGGLRQGLLTPRQAKRQIRKSVPGVGEQLGNIPKSMQVALQQGRPGDVMSQADIGGVKNVVPYTDSFDPGTAIASTGLAAGTLGLQNRFRHVKDLRDTLHGSDTHAVQAMKDTLPAALHEDWDKFRRVAPVPSGGGIKARLQRAFVPPGDTSIGGAMLPGNKLQQATTKATAARAAAMKPATTGQSVLGGLKQVGSKAGLPALAALAPMMYREWLGSGYRTGAQPAQQLVEASQPRGK